jgi:hypothetical protein
VLWGLIVAIVQPSVDAVMMGKDGLGVQRVLKKRRVQRRGIAPRGGIELAATLLQ